MAEEINRGQTLQIVELVDKLIEVIASTSDPRSVLGWTIEHLHDLAWQFPSNNPLHNFVMDGEPDWDRLADMAARLKETGLTDSLQEELLRDDQR